MSVTAQAVIDNINKTDWLLQSVQDTLEVVECAYDTSALADKCYAIAITKITKELLGNVRATLGEAEVMVRQMN